MTDKQIENLYKIKDLCCEKTKYCNIPCSVCEKPCTEYQILVLTNEALEQ